jgi:protein-disulfide isomerase
MSSNRATIVKTLGLFAACMLGPISAGHAQTANEMKALRSQIESIKESQALRDEVRALKDSQVTIQKDLAEIKTLLQQIRQAPPSVAAPSAPARPTEVAMATDYNANTKGGQNVKYTLVEFTDYQCPFCSRYYRDTYPEIMKQYVDSGKIKYVVREFPLESIHPQAFKASEAALCAGDQQKYFDMHDRLFSEQKALGASDLPKHAEAVGLDVAKFQDCLTSGKFAKNVRRDLADGAKAGVTGTPSFFLGVTQADGSVKVLNTLKGAQPLAAFKDALDSMIASQ